jgi:hypothetical protein
MEAHWVVRRRSSPHILDNRLTDVGEVSLTRRLRFTQGRFLVLIYVRLSRSMDRKGNVSSSVPFSLLAAETTFTEPLSRKGCCIVAPLHSRYFPRHGIIIPSS